MKAVFEKFYRLVLIKQVNSLTLGLIFISFSFVSSVAAHDPIFAPGPHVLYKGGIEVHGRFAQSEKGSDKKSEYVSEFKYGLTGDWVAGIELPYKNLDGGGNSLNGVDDVMLSTKYRFWRNDSLGKQETAAVLVKLKLDSSDSEVSNNAADSILGLTYGYESLKWYRWASIRHRFNDDINKQTLGNLQRGDKTLIDLVVGYRPKLNSYLEPDMVYMVELNSEFSQRSKINGMSLNDSGGKEFFISPGFMWTLRNMAIKGGVQLPVYADLNGVQSESDYRFKLSIEWHL
jgi:outer membrane putative beta-barrel porin/alpha-amylase